jgi:hypothetical protein
VGRAARAERLAGEELAVAVDAGPLRRTLDEEVLDRITRRVHELVDDRGAVEEPRDAGFLRTGPEVLPPTETGVLAAREHFMEVLDELRMVPVPVVQHRMMVVRLRHRQEDVDAVTLRGLGETVDEGVVRRGVEVAPVRWTGCGLIHAASA